MKKADITRVLRDVPEGKSFQIVFKDNALGLEAFSRLIRQSHLWFDMDIQVHARLRRTYEQMIDRGNWSSNSARSVLVIIKKYQTRSRSRTIFEIVDRAGGGIENIVVKAPEPQKEPA